MEEKLGQVVQVTNAQTDLLKSLDYRSIDIEPRSRRNNMILRGISENRGENCFQLVRDFITNHLDLDSSNMYIARAHRLGRPDPRRQSQRRPIIVKFRDFCDTESIKKSVTLLRGTGFSIDYDFPKEIQQARSHLWPMYKELKRNEPNAKIIIQ